MGANIFFFDIIILNNPFTWNISIGISILLSVSVLVSVIGIFGYRPNTSRNSIGVHYVSGMDTNPFSVLTCHLNEFGVITVRLKAIGFGVINVNQQCPKQFPEAKASTQKAQIPQISTNRNYQVDKMTNISKQHRSQRHRVRLANQSC